MRLKKSLLLGLHTCFGDSEAEVGCHLLPEGHEPGCLASDTAHGSPAVGFGGNNTGGLQGLTRLRIQYPESWKLGTTEKA